MQKKTQQKFIFVFGGVASGIGKGVLISSVAYCLKQSGLDVTIIKVDPYLNIDAGTISPFEHGEVFVLDDGGEVDLDLGNYERILNQELTYDNSITSGKVFQNVLTKERKGEYLGKTVQLVSQVTNQIVQMIYHVAQKKNSKNKLNDLILIELGGTVGDYESNMYFEALRQILLEQGKENVMNVMVSYVPILHNTDEKSKPTQNAIKSAREIGISPDMIFLRSEQEVSQQTKNKIGYYGILLENYVISVFDKKNLFEVPLLLDENDVISNIQKHLNLPIKRSDLSQMKKITNFVDKTRQKSRVTIVGKYTKFQDAYLSLTKAIEQASYFCENGFEISWVEAAHLEEVSNEQLYTPAINVLKHSQAVIIAGGYGMRGFEGKIEASKFCRENNIPLLGICFGFQAMVIDHARSIGIENAHSGEFQEAVKSEHYVINLLPDSTEEVLGGTMRKGSKVTILQENSLIHKIYNKDTIHPRYRHRYEVNLAYLDKLQTENFKFTGLDETKRRMEVLERDDLRFFIGVQFHPEFTSTFLQPNPLFVAFLQSIQTNFNKQKKPFNFKLQF